MSLKITILVENSPGEHLALEHEHGLSFHIDRDGRQGLFDTGQSGAFIRNAKKLNIDLNNLEYVAVSHGHYDHSGGVRPLAEKNTNFRLVTGQGFFEEKYARRGNAHEYLGNDFGRTFLEDKGIELEVVDEPHREIAPGVHALTAFPRQNEDEKVNPRFEVFRDGEFAPDVFGDEILLAVESPRGLVVLLGCSHPGVKNMLDFVTETLKKPVHAVLGGTHLVESSTQSLGKTLDYLKAMDVKIIGVSHCTGQKAMENLGTFFNDRFFHNRTGCCLFVK